MKFLTDLWYQLFFLTILFISIDLYAVAGKVVYSYGDVQAISNLGETRPLVRGGTVDQGDAINTNNGRIQIRFSDGGFVALQPGTIYRLDEYEFQGVTDGNEKSSFYLVEGGIRLVTGLIGRKNKETFKLSTPVATIGIRGTSGKVVHTEATGTLLAGYGGIWDLTSGSFSGPVEPGQAYSCNGLSCAEVTGFGQRQEASAETEEEEEEEEKEEEEKEEEEQEEEEQVAEDENEEQEEEEQVAEDKNEAQEEEEQVAEDKNEAQEEKQQVAEERDERIAEERDEQVTENKRPQTKPQNEGKFGNVEDAGEPEGFYETVTQDGPQTIPSEEGEISFFQANIEQNSESLADEGEGIRFKAGEQRNESGVNTFFASPSGVNAISQQSLGSAFTVTRTVDLTTRQDFPIAAAGGNATIFSSNGEMFAGSDRDTIGQQTSLFFSDLSLIEASTGLISDSIQSRNVQQILDSLTRDERSALAGTPARVHDTNTIDSITFGRFINGFALAATIDETSGVIRRGLISLDGNKSFHFIFSNSLATIPTSQLVRYDLSGASNSTSGSSVGSGITSGSIKFDFGLGYGALDASLSHDGTIHTLFGDFLLIDKIFTGGSGLAINSAGNHHEARFEGFFSGSSNNLPQGIGLSYGILTQDPILGTATFSQGAVGSSNLTNSSSIADFGFVGTAFAGITSTGVTIADSYLFESVSGDSATTTGNLVTAFSTSSPGDRCASTCTFDRGTSNVTLDSTGPSPFDHFDIITGGAQIANTPLRSNWGRFSGNYTLTQDGITSPTGTAHTIAFRNITPVGANLPSFLAGTTATYDTKTGGTQFTHIYTDAGVVQSEILSTGTNLQATIDFGAGTVSVAFNGSFSLNNGTAGSWQLAGSSANNFGATAFTNIALTGTVTSSGISGSNGVNCSVNCNIGGVTDTVLVGQFAEGFGGAVSADTAPTNTNQPLFTVSGTYLLEQSSTFSSTITE